MTTNLFPMTSVVTVRACAQRNEHNKKTSPNWWTPLFGWSNHPDYMDPLNNSKSEEEKKEGSSDQASKSKFARGCFTEDKAKLLRKLTSDTSSYHDVMYHSAIASRLASDFNPKTHLDL